MWRNKEAILGPRKYNISKSLLFQIDIKCFLFLFVFSFACFTHSFWESTTSGTLSMVPWIQKCQQSPTAFLPGKIMDADDSDRNHRYDCPQATAHKFNQSLLNMHCAYLFNKHSFTEYQLRVKYCARHFEHHNNQDGIGPCWQENCHTICRINVEM